MSNMSRDDLEIGQDACEDRDLIDYQVALDEAEQTGEPIFSFDQFMDRVEANRARSAVTLPAPSLDELPF
jgi:hypothetical protein